MNRRQAIVALCGGCAWAGGVARRAGAALENTHSIDIPLAQLMAFPEAFDGAVVRVWGFVRIESGATAVYLSRDDCEYRRTGRGIRVAANDSAPEGSAESGVNGRYAMVEGRFRARVQGHNDPWSGSIEQVHRMEAWAVRMKR